MRLERSYLHPMIHRFKKNGRIVREVLCYAPSSKTQLGKADHKYDPQKCGWNLPLHFAYVGPVLCCIRCHRHLWSKEAYDRCPQCHKKLGAEKALHTPVTADIPPTGTIGGSSAYYSEYTRS